MLETFLDVRVRYAETDAMGITYHANYLPWLEMTRVHMLDEIGLPYRDIEKAGFFMPVLEAHLKYLKPTRFDDTVTVHAWMAEKPRVRLRIDYELTRGTDAILNGYTLHAFMNAQGEAIRPPDLWRDKIDPHFAK